jgi:hypothetical protein
VDAGCFAHIAIPFDEYIQLRRNLGRFAVAHGHQSDEVERVVNRRPGYFEVETLEVAAPTPLAAGGRCE